MEPKLFSSKMVCKILDIDRTTMTNWIKSGAPVPPITRYFGPNSTTLNGMGVRMWGGEDIEKFKEWKASQIYSRCSSRFRRHVKKTKIDNLAPTPTGNSACDLVTRAKNILIDRIIEGVRVNLEADIRIEEKARMLIARAQQTNNATNQLIN